MNKRNTKQKEIIIDFLNKNKNKHLTIQEISSELESNIGVTTIYRMINSLIKEGQVSKIALNNKQGYCYQYNPKNRECNTHYHLICEECGKLEHFESKRFKETEKEALNTKDFSIDDTKVVFYGKCKKCIKNKMCSKFDEEEK